MARPHKYAGSRLRARTALSRERVRELGRASAAAAVGTRWDGRSETRLVSSGPDSDAFAIHGALLHKPHQLDFHLKVSDVDGTGRCEVTTTIAWYLTTQMKAYWFIPLGGKTMVALPTYLQYVEDLGQRIRAEDPTAAITITKGEKVIVGIDGGATPSDATSLLPSAASRPAPPPTRDSLLSGGRACSSCTTAAYDDDVFCGQCGTVLPTAPATSTTETVL